MNKLFTTFSFKVTTFSLLFILSTLTAFGQSTDASLTGVIREQEGSTLPGATVLVKNESTGFSTGTVADKDGRFKLTQLPLGGPYTVTISFLGYQEQKKTGIFLNQGDKITLNTELSQSTQAMEDLV
ncbi:MAG: carboxypeptidase regulatory-like domain-containing protein, partial [Bacteroidia bacterium]|nr:carboxypeptidase regulatory-like domain-containing protein [Bacteroidia bacterium]